ncbi:TPA: hypothetical protein MJQ62_004540 [Salmonella enterica subsp. enterica serovar Paratyphi B var. L-tartrate +]|nr:hypothetical protein [Salmonella enterica subsp. enterica serovar Java]HBB8740689.1 hypothetical protein [Salmonella enterica subsp. enterica serovar Paratyphi A]HBK1075742.1 hypothetical protein [Salmonella enterica]HBZ1823221.1 hypothetical protein [Salmonella enterica subsp. enterica serovar Paratyphi B var. L-tartrate +]
MVMEEEGGPVIIMLKIAAVMGVMAVTVAMAVMAAMVVMAVMAGWEERE